MLELAVLGLLHDSAMHGYELRKRLHELPGHFRAISCGSLYPALGRMLRAGLLVEASGGPDRNACNRRARRVYRLTAAGKARFAELAGDCGPRACEDDAFALRVAFFSRTPRACRLRILRARRRHVEQRGESSRAALARERADRYALDLHRLGLEHSEREVRWLDELIARECADQQGHHG